MKLFKKARRLSTRAGLALCAVLFLASVCWIVFDDLFAPLEAEARTVEIPSLCGLMQKDIARVEGLEYEIEYRYDALVEAGRVLSQSPPAGSRRKLSARFPSCKLKLTVSLGEESLLLPSVAGMDAREATSLLRGLGCAVRIKKQAGSAPTGSVIATEPSVGARIPRGSEVLLLVCEGAAARSVLVPDLRGLSRGEALTRLWLSELAVERVVEIEATEPEGLVVRQSHRPETLVPAGTRVTVFVSRRSAKETKSNLETEGRLESE